MDGTVPWYESDAGKAVNQRLSTPQTSESLDRLLQRIDTLEQAVNRLSDLMHQGPGLAAMAIDTVDETIRQAEQRGVILEERLQNALQLAEALTSNEMVQQVHQLTELSHQLPGLIAMTVDMVDEGMAEANVQGLDPQKVLEAAGQLGQALSQTTQEAIQPIKSVWKLTGALKDPDRQRALGFLMTFLKNWGSTLR